MEQTDEVIRAKWLMDGATTLEEAIEKLLDAARHLVQLESEGWKLRYPISDAYGFLYRDE